jgi:TetR/AcrR family tetracycline transcriptional repressor
MVRPKQPLISRAGAIAVALRVVDEDGLEALSTRRLARELNVTGPALYHHFRDKMDIVTGVVELVLAKVMPPPSEEIEWREWILTISSRTRDVLLQHPNVVMAMAYRVPRTWVRELYEECARLMTEGGVSPLAIIPLMEAVETYMLGYVVFATAPAETVHAFGNVPKSSFPHLRNAINADAVADDVRYRLTVESIIDGWVDAQLHQPHI